MRKFPKAMNEIRKLRAYARLPDSLERAYPELAANQPKDIGRTRNRLSTIKAVLGGRRFGRVADLGGHSGYFCLSLIEAGIIDSAVVYDSSSDAILAGRLMAKEMGVSRRIEFVEHAIDMSFLKTLPHFDAIFCLNLLHHAGISFDVEPVRRCGWGRYAENWLSEIRRKSECAVISLGFQAGRPVNWGAPKAYRPAEFMRLVERAGWSVMYDANVWDVDRFGIKSAEGRFTRGATRHRPRPDYRKLLRKLLIRISSFTRIPLPLPPREKAQDYFIYILTGANQDVQLDTGVLYPLVLNASIFE